jgi:hypothetical protein
MGPMYAFETSGCLQNYTALQPRRLYVPLLVIHQTEGSEQQENAGSTYFLAVPLKPFRIVLKS